MTMTDTTAELERELEPGLDVESSDAESFNVEGAAPRGASVRAMALGLWGVVGGMLAYGVFQTVLKAAALFG